MGEGALSRPLAERLVETAAAAPSVHNSQPWRFVARLADRVIEVYADPARTMLRGDPRGRAVHIACGAALFNLRLAVAQAGAEPVTRLLPNPRDPMLLASVRLAGPRRPRPLERDLHAAIRHPGDSRPRPFTSRTALRGLLAALLEAAALEGASLRVMERGEAVRLLQSIAAADRSLWADPRYVAELQEFSPARPGAGARPAWSGTGSHLAVLSTGSDDRASWLRTGQALQRVLLLAAHRGLDASPVTPMLEAPEFPPRPDVAHGAQYVEMVVRLGQGRAGTARQRRPVSQVMRVISGLPVRQDEGPRREPPPALPPQPRELMPST